MKNKRKIFENIAIYIAIFMAVSSIILTREIGDLDEIWNYNFANCITKGLVPYRDFNIVITPLLPIIEGIILKILPNELIIMRILAVILASSILFMLYKILQTLKTNKSLNILAVLTIGYLLKNYYCIDYNFFVLFLTLIIIYLEMKKIMNRSRTTFTERGFY